MTDRRDYSELIEVINGLKVEMAQIASDVHYLKEQDIPLSRLKIGIKEMCIIFVWLVVGAVTPALSGHYYNVNKNAEQDNKIESLSERQERLLNGYKYDE